MTELTCTRCNYATFIRMCPNCGTAIYMVKK